MKAGFHVDRVTDDEDDSFTLNDHSETHKIGSESDFT